VDEDKDEKLGFLMELRKFKTESPELFRKIQNMPLRARSGRKDRLKNNSTICFIRNQRRDAFYLVKADGNFEELSFVETAKEFYAVASEQGIPLHENHHDQVTKAITDFHEKIQQEIGSVMAVDTTQGPNEKKALVYLDGFLSLPFASEEEKKIIRAAKQAIKLGRFQKLQRDVNKLKRDTKTTKLKPVDLLDAMMKIINLYPVHQTDTMEERPTVTIRSYEKLKPEIIISESFAQNK
jgi:hypothetical protein